MGNLRNDRYLSSLRTLMGTRQQERKAETRQRLIEAAADLIAEQGVDAVSVDAVAEAGGRTSGAIYDHFGSKQGLLLALLDEWQHTVVTVVLAELELASDLSDRLRAVARNVVVAPSAETRRMLLLEHELWLRAGRDPQVAKLMTARARQAQHWLARGFATWIEAGILPTTTDPDTLAVRFRAMVSGLQLQLRLDAEGLSEADVVAALELTLGLTVPSALTQTD
jgi:AcrR family transcriptional regulator